MAEEKSQYLGFIKAVLFTVKQFRLYSDTHPITKQALESLNAEISKCFIEQDKFSIGSLKGRLIANGSAISDKESSSVELAKMLDKLNVEGIVFNKGADLQEVTTFLKLMAARPKDLEEKGGFQKAFDELALPHIKITHGKFQLVEEGQAVAEEEEIGQGGGGEPPIKSMSDIIKRIREKGPEAPTSPQEEMPEFECENIVLELEKKPKEVAEMAIADIKNPAHVELAIKKVVNFLVSGLISFLVEQGKDISKALERLAKELEKSVGKLDGGPEMQVLIKKIPKLFEEASDDLRIQMMVKQNEKTPGDTKALEKMAKKLFKDDEVRDRLAPAVRQELSEAGVPAEDVQSIFDKMSEAKAKKKKRVTVDSEILAELKRKAELFDKHGPGDGSGNADASEEVVQLKRERKKLLDEKERVDSVIRNLSEGLLVVDKAGKVVMMNPAAEKMLGVNKSEKVGKPVAEGLKEEHMLAMTKGDLSGSQEELAKNVEVVSLNDETQRILQASTTVVENEDGQTVGMVSVLSDVTKQKEVEDLKTKFVSNVSHELRTPLVAIQKSLAVILEKEVGDISPDQERFLSIAHRNIDRLSRLINDLLDVNKLEAAKMNLKPLNTSVKELANHVVATLDTWAKDKKVNFAVEVEEGLSFEVDSDRITQVLTNLCGNALKFTPEDGTVTVYGKKESVNGKDFIQVGVKDTGIGIAPEDQQKIFQKFEQVSLAQPSGVSSTGLGLTIAKELIELHSGEIWVESEEGKGSSFIFRLPVKFEIHEEVRPRV